jgi:hypothetical protein
LLCRHFVSAQASLARASHGGVYTNILRISFLFFELFEMWKMLTNIFSIFDDFIDLFQHDSVCHVLISTRIEYSHTQFIGPEMVPPTCIVVQFIFPWAFDESTK